MTDPIPYQSSYCLANNGSCSNSTYCACALLASGERVCTQQMSCEYAAPCGVNNTCAKDNTTCVLDPRCNYVPLCYAFVIFSPELCPPYDTVGGNGGERK